MRRQASFLALVVAIFAVSPAAANFIKIGEIVLSSTGNHHGLAFSGANWHIANDFTNTFHNYDASFNYINDSTVAGISDMRGMTYDRNSGHLFVGDDGGAVVKEVTLSGSIIQSWTGGGSGLNALAYDARDDTIWIAYYGNGQVEHRTRVGGFLSSFSTAPRAWTGLALAPPSNTLFLMDDNVDDTVWEYTFAGALVGQVITTDQMTGNGLGLAYDPATAILSATSQEGRVSFFQDISRVPEPATMALIGVATLAGCGSGGLLVKRRRRHKTRKAGAAARR